MNITHIIPAETPVWLAMVTAQLQNKMLLTNGRQTILADQPMTGFSELRVRVKK